MPLTVTSPNLPTYVENKPKHIIKRWVEIFNEILDGQGEEAAYIAANGWLMRELERMDKYHKRATLKFEVSDTQFIKRTADGDDYVSFKLADTQRDSFGVELTEDVLKQWAEYINSGNPLVGDIDHEYYDQVLSGMLSDEETMEMIRNKKGIAKGVQAIYEKGKLWVKALIDKRYRKTLEKAKGVSLEALIQKDENNKITGAELMGFTFGVKHDPVISGTELHYNVA